MIIFSRLINKIRRNRITILVFLLFTFTLYRVFSVTPPATANHRVIKNDAIKSNQDRNLAASLADTQVHVNYDNKKSDVVSKTDKAPRPDSLTNEKLGVKKTTLLEDESEEENSKSQLKYKNPSQLEDMPIYATEEDIMVKLAKEKMKQSQQHREEGDRLNIALESVDIVDTRPASQKIPFIITGLGSSRWESGERETSQKILDTVILPRGQEKYPIDKLIKLPSISPLKLRSSAKLGHIQATTFKETSDQKTQRLARKDIIKDAFINSWNTYKKYAWGHDEVKPVSKKFTDPFVGWAATLVDALDTLKIMGYTKEYNEALRYVEDIDFKSSYRSEIPLFETVIRYLGGLLSAYDLSKGKDTILLIKARELADNLMGAFDTPNRMPLSFFKWTNKDSLNHYRAGSKSVFSEIASLSMEFTRLSQLTSDSTYFDAIQRITHQIAKAAPEMEFPYLFSGHVDVSGCEIIPYEDEAKPLSINEIKGRRNPIGKLAQVQEPKTYNNVKRAQKSTQPYDEVIYSTFLNARQYAMCKPRDMTAVFDNDYQMKISTGGLIDSAYEYYLKEYILFEGIDDAEVTIYKDLYIETIEAIKTHLLFRPVAQGDPDILLAGNIIIKPDGSQYSDDEMSHLSCFLGGLFAMGARALNRPEDLVVGEKLTRGCVWAYNATRTGVMPENFHIARCHDSLNCRFNNEIIKTEIMGKADVFIRRPSTYSRPQGVSQIVDSDGSTRWPVNGFYDQPLSFHRMDPKYILRPEAIESVFYMYRISGDRKWQDIGWKMFESIDKLCRTPRDVDGYYGYSAVNDVSNDSIGNYGGGFKDESESFWMAETLKYFFLLFEEPDVISLDQYVLNTEAHPFRRYNF